MFAAASRATTQDQSGLTIEAIWVYTPPSSTFDKLCSDSPRSSTFTECLGIIQFLKGMYLVLTLQVHPI